MVCCEQVNDEWKMLDDRARRSVWLLASMWCRVGFTHDMLRINASPLIFLLAGLLSGPAPLLHVYIKTYLSILAGIPVPL